jgi:hypothetical protein
MTVSIDEAKILRGKDIKLNDVITLHQPTVSDIVEFGERDFFANMYSFCAIPSDMKSALDDAGLDFMELSDWRLFLMLTRDMHYEATSLIIPNVDFAKYELMQVSDTEEIVLTDGVNIINEQMYNEFIPYIRAQIGYTLKREKAANKFTKQVLIDEDRAKRKASADKEYESTINTMILSCVNTEEFSYTYQSVYDITFYQLLRSFVQIQKKKAACALYQGSMSGFVDTSKINKSNFSWIYEKEHK